MKLAGKDFFHFVSVLFLVCSVTWAEDSIQGLDLVKAQKYQVDLKKANLKATVLVFLSAACPCSDSHIVELNRLSGKYPDIQFVGVHSNANESVEMATQYFRTKGVNFPVLQDEKAVFADRFKAYKTPHVFVLSPAGEKLYQGGVSDSSNFSKAKVNYLVQALDSIQNGKPVALAESRTLGCVIMRESDMVKNVW